jgi:hypothetical protein
MQSESRKAPSKRKPDLSPANIHFSHLSSPGLWLKETIASNTPVSAVCFPCLKAPACESSLKAQTGNGTGLPFPSTRGFVSPCLLSWFSVHTRASECFSTQTQSQKKDVLLNMVLPKYCNHAYDLPIHRKPTSFLSSG